MKFIENLDLENCSGMLSYRELGSVIIKGRIEAFNCDNNSDTLARSQSQSQFESFNTIDSSSALNSPLKAQAITTPLKPPPIVKNTVFSSPFKNLQHVPPQRHQSEGASIYMPAQRKRSASMVEHRAPNGSSIPKRRRSASLSDAPIPSKKVMFDLVDALAEIFPDYDYRFTSSLQFVNVEMSRVVNEVNGYLAELAETEPKFMEKLWRSVDLLMNIYSPSCDVYTYKGDRDDNGPLNDRKSLWSFHFFIFNRDSNRLCYFGCKASSKLQKYLHSIDDDEDDDDDEAESSVVDIEEDGDDGAESGGCDRGGNRAMFDSPESTCDNENECDKVSDGEDEDEASSESDGVDDDNESDDEPKELD